jgi:hypothetical protein
VKWILVPFLLANGVQDPVDTREVASFSEIGRCAIAAAEANNGLAHLMALTEAKRETELIGFLCVREDQLGVTVKLRLGRKEEQP